MRDDKGTAVALSVHAKGHSAGRQGTMHGRQNSDRRNAGLLCNLLAFLLPGWPTLEVAL